MYSKGRVTEGLRKPGKTEENKNKGRKDTVKMIGQCAVQDGLTWKQNK